MQARPTGRDQWLHEAFERGAGVFAARITPTGERLFYFRYSDATGSRRYLTLGSYHQHGGNDGLTVAAARALARQRSDLLRSGVRDLHGHFATLRQASSVSAVVEHERAAAELQRLKADAERTQIEQQRRITLRTLFDRWAAIDLQPQNRADGTRTGRKDGGAYTRAQFERRVFPTLGTVAVEEITKAHLLHILDAVKAEGKLRTATILLTDLKQMFRFALTRDLVSRNPLDLISKRSVGGPAVERVRVLSKAEIEVLSTALPKAKLPPGIESAVWLMLATAARLGELLGATWVDSLVDRDKLLAVAQECDVKLGFVDLRAQTWYLANTKNQRDHTIHLSAFAICQFEALKAVRDNNPLAELKFSPWIFPAQRGDLPLRGPNFGKPLSDRQRFLERRLAGRTRASETLKLAGGRWTAHDLRRTAATLMAEMGVSGDVIDECLNHIIESRVRRVYVRDRRVADQAKAFDALGARLLQLVERRPVVRAHGDSASNRRSSPSSSHPSRRAAI